MAKFEQKFESSKQDWETPQDLFDLLHRQYHFTFDLAADKNNTKCEKYYTEENDALSVEWHGRCWLNPPYGGNSTNKLALWVEKAYVECKKPTCEVTLLIPARTNTNWWHEYCMRSSELMFIKGRPKFGDAKHGLPQPLAVVHFTGKNWLVSPKLFTLDLKNMEIY